MKFVPPYSVAFSGNLALHFHPDHLADLRASGLNDETLRAAGVYSIAPRLIEHFIKSLFSEIDSALCFPYQGADFARIKLFPALGKMKYAQPPKTRARLYFPLFVDDRPVIVTEGEKKTLAAHQAGLNAVGVGGVWNWLLHGEPISDFNLIGWDGRDVTIIPDSDIFQRVDLMRAIFALGRELQTMGAHVLVAQIPQNDMVKVGLDDFLVAGGNIQSLDVFALSHRTFRRVSAWHRRWNFQKTLIAA